MLNTRSLSLLPGPLWFGEVIPIRVVFMSKIYLMTHDTVDKVFGWKVLLSEIMWRLQVQSQQPVSLTRNTYNNLTLVPGHGTVYPCGSNKRVSLRFCVDSRVRHETPESSRRTYRPKRCDDNNKYEFNSPNILSNNCNPYLMTTWGRKMQIIWFDLISLFHGIWHITFVGYLMPKPSL